MVAKPSIMPQATPDKFEFAPIGHIESPFREKFGAPRQSGIVREATGIIHLREPFQREEMWRGLESFSHIWLIWAFHLIPGQQAGNNTTVRPPRLGGNERLGIFSTRSPFRPNRLGLSAVELVSLEAGKGIIEVAGIDLADATPIFDIKPYVPYCDRISEAVGGFAAERPEALLNSVITYSPNASATLAGGAAGDLLPLLEETLRADPRPAYQVSDERTYGITLGSYNILWRVIGAEIRVEKIAPLA